MSRRPRLKCAHALRCLSPSICGVPSARLTRGVTCSAVAVAHFRNSRRPVIGQRCVSTLARRRHPSVALGLAGNGPRLLKMVTPGSQSQAPIGLSGWCRRRRSSSRRRRFKRFARCVGSDAAMVTSASNSSRVKASTLSRPSTSGRPVRRSCSRLISQVPPER